MPTEHRRMPTEFRHPFLLLPVSLWLTLALPVRKARMLERALGRAGRNARAQWQRLRMAGV